MLQRNIWLVGRILFYTVLFLLLGIVIYALSHDKFLPALVFGVMFIITLYFGLIRLRIPAYSVVLRNGRVVFFIPETTVRNRFDFVSRGQIIVELPHYGLLDRPYKLDIFSPDSDGCVSCCRLTLHLDYLMEQAGWQRAYDSFIVHQEKLSQEVRRLLYQSADHLVCRPMPMQSEEAMQAYLEPIVAELNKGLESVGVIIEDATCSFTAGSSLARFVSAEQEIVEKRAANTTQAGAVRG